MGGESLVDVGKRLESMVTRWSLVRVAHDASTASASKARNELVLRYADATKAYIHAIVRDAHRADEIAQNVVLRMLAGDFAGADPNRGRFRDLLKVAARNMVRSHWARENVRRAAALDSDSVASDDDPNDAEQWVASWRQNVLDLTWTSLNQFEQSQPKSCAFTILRLRARFPDASSEELAQQLSEIVEEEISAETFRQKLRRARMRFAELLVDEVADGLEKPSADDLEEELVALGLIEYVRKLLSAEWKDSWWPDSRR